jgi:hypothetical protein
MYGTFIIYNFQFFTCFSEAGAFNADPTLHFHFGADTENFFGNTVVHCADPDTDLLYVTRKEVSGSGKSFCTVLPCSNMKYNIFKL